MSALELSPSEIAAIEVTAIVVECNRLRRRTIIEMEDSDDEDRIVCKPKKSIGGSCRSLEVKVALAARTRSLILSKVHRKVLSSFKPCLRCECCIKSM